MGAVVETPSIYLDMTAEDNLKQQALVLGLPKYDSIPEILKLVGLENTGKKKGLRTAAHPEEKDSSGRRRQKRKRTPDHVRQPGHSGQNQQKPLKDHHDHKRHHHPDQPADIRFFHCASPFPKEIILQLL